MFMRHVRLLAVALLWFAPVAAAQQQKPAEKPEESLAEAARRIRAQRQGASPTQRVWTNDTLPSSRVVLGGEASSSGSAVSSASGDAAVSSPVSEEEEAERAEAEQAVKQEKARLEQLKGDLNLLERDFTLAQQQFYSNPAYANDAADQRRLDEQQTQVAAKKADIATSEAKVKELERALEEINQRLGPKQQDPLTPAEQQGQWAARLQPLRQEVAQIESEIQNLRSQLLSTPAVSPGTGNDYTRDRITALEAKRDALRQQIAAIEDEARRAGAPAGWTRPPR